ncbi:hypothetical protein BVRB_6g135340 [Beta vulgaris subsp. vulgaris]|nr:hypothetical protein BVRB_6g135340 [Beta vulgaris subsp. vulgaris]
MGKDGSFLPETDTTDFVDYAYAKLESLKQACPSKSDLELEGKAFEHTIVWWRDSRTSRRLWTWSYSKG